MFASEHGTPFRNSFHVDYNNEKNHIFHNDRKIISEYFEISS